MVPGLPKVLIVEDDAAIRTMLAAALRREAVSVDAAPDGAVALELMRVNAYAVVIVDLMMPRMNGFDLLEAMRAEVPTPRPVIFVMTACDETAFRGLDPDLVHGVLRKPFDVERLVEMICDCAALFPRAAQAPTIVRRSRDSASVC